MIVIDFKVGDKIELLNDEVMEIIRIVDYGGKYIYVEFRDTTRRWYSESYLLKELEKIWKSQRIMHTQTG